MNVERAVAIVTDAQSTGHIELRRWAGDVDGTHGARGGAERDGITIEDAAIRDGQRPGAEAANGGVAAVPDRSGARNADRASAADLIAKVGPLRTRHNAAAGNVKRARAESADIEIGKSGQGRCGARHVDCADTGGELPKRCLKGRDDPAGDDIQHAGPRRPDEQIVAAGYRAGRNGQGRVVDRRLLRGGGR